MAAGLTDDQLKALTDAEMRQAIGYWGGKLSEMRRKNEYYYLGLAKGDLSPPEIEGRSSVVDTTVRNTVLGMMCPLVKIFCGTENVVEFQATQDGDEEKAFQATEYLNYLLMKKNPGYQIIHSWIHDSLTQKNGILKVWWDKSFIETKEEYRGQTDEEMTMLLDDDEVEPITHKDYPDEEDAENRQEAITHLTEQLNQIMQSLPQGMPQPQQIQQQVMQIQGQIQEIQNTPPVMLHDITVKRKKTEGRLCIENVPPEEFLISRQAKTIADTPFCAHRVVRTISDLTAAGYKNVDQISSDDSAASMNAERVERIGYDDESPYLQDYVTTDPVMRKVWLTECYIKCDVDGTGIAEWRKVVRAGNQILENVECDGPPFVSICPNPLPHRFYGMCPADLALESQRIQTSLLRAQLDNVYLQTNGRYFAVEGQVNLDDLLISRPGGVVRIKQQGAVGQLNQGAGDVGHAMNMMEFFQNFAEESTGWTRQSNGGNVVLNQTATQSNIVTNRADNRIDIIARTFAETGFTELFRLMLRLVSQYQNKEVIVKLNGKFVNIDPREWTNQFDLSINVGLGTGNKDQQVQHLMAMIQSQGAGMSVGISTPENLYNSHVKLAAALGFKRGDAFFTNPALPPDPNNPLAPQPPDPDIMKIQAASQAKSQELQEKAKYDQAHLQMMMQVEKHKQEMQGAQIAAQQHGEQQLRLSQLEKENQIALLKAQSASQIEEQKLMFERWKAELESSTKIHIANVSQGTDPATVQADEEVAQAANDKLIMVLHDQSSKMEAMINVQGQTLNALLQHMQRPKTIIRGPDGRAQGIQ